MAAPILTMAAVIICPHGGQVRAVPSNVAVLIAGSPVLVATDVCTIVACVFNISGAPAPCLTVQWTMPAVKTKVKNIPVLLQSSIPLCIGGSGSVPGTVVSCQTQVMGT